MEPKSFVDQLKGAMSPEAGAAPQGQKLAVKSVMELLMDNTGSQAGAMNLMEKALYPKIKSMGTVDIAALRVVSLSDRVAVQRNAETRFLNFLEAKNSSANLTDYQYRIIERNIGTQYAGFFNLDATSLPANVQSSYAQRYNTATAVGDTLKISYQLQNIAGMQGNAGSDVFEAQVDDEIVRIRKQMNRTLLSNTEVISEAAAQVPQLGGFITRSTVSPISAGSGNFTNALLQQGYDQIAALYGYEQLALFVTKGQMAVIIDLMINRFPGENSATFAQNMSSTLGGVGADAKGINTNVVYMPYPGVAIPVYYDLDMPANTAVLFKADWPRVARMKFNNAVGPQMLMRPEPTLFDLALIFELFSLDDPQINSRVVYQNLQS